MACVFDACSNTEIVGCLAVAASPFAMSTQLMRSSKDWVLDARCPIKTVCCLVGEMGPRATTCTMIYIYQMDGAFNDRRSLKFISYLAELAAPRGRIDMIAKIIKRAVLSMFVVLKPNGYLAGAAAPRATVDTSINLINGANASKSSSHPGARVLPPEATSLCVRYGENYQDHQIDNDFSVRRPSEIDCCLAREAPPDATTNPGYCS
jgi:hypothetical protein